MQLIYKEMHNQLCNRLLAQDFYCADESRISHLPGAERYLLCRAIWEDSVRLALIAVSPWLTDWNIGTESASYEWTSKASEGAAVLDSTLRDLIAAYVVRALYGDHATRDAVEDESGVSIASRLLASLHCRLHRCE